MGFRDSNSKQIGGKFLVYGDTSSGKSFFTLTFPKLASVDSEAGLAHYEGRDVVINNKKYNNLVIVDNTADLEDLEDSLDDLLDGKYDGKIESFAVDSETKFYNTMQVGAMEVEERRARKKGEDVDDQTVSQRQWGRIKLINMKLQQAKIDLSTKGVHVVSVAQGMDLRDKAGKNVIGEKPDMHKSVPFDYDTVLRFYKEKDKTTGKIKFFAEVEKDRTEVTNIGDIFENCTFDVWKDYYNKKSKLDKMVTNYTKDLKTSTEGIMTDADKADELVKEFKENLKKVAPESQSLVNSKIKELELSVKNLNISDTNKLQQLVNYTKSLV